MRLQSKSYEKFPPTMSVRKSMSHGDIFKVVNLKKDKLLTNNDTASLLPSNSSAVQTSVNNRTEGITTCSEDSAASTPISVTFRRRLASDVKKTYTDSRGNVECIEMSELHSSADSDKEQLEEPCGRWITWRSRICQYASRLGQRILYLLEGVSSPNTDSGEIERRSVRYVPQSLERVLERTNFTKDELKLLYRNFKNECPNGVISEDSFKEIYSQFFPNGDTDLYASFVFKAFDVREEGHINFEDYAVGLSSLLRGTLKDKLEWTFKLYDIHRDNEITKDEIYEIVRSIHMLLGKHTEATSEETYEDHMNDVFRKLVKQGNESITFEDFYQACIKDESIVQSMKAFDSIL